MLRARARVGPIHADGHAPAGCSARKESCTAPAVSTVRPQQVHPFVGTRAVFPLRRHRCKKVFTSRLLSSHTPPTGDGTEAGKRRPAARVQRPGLRGAGPSMLCAGQVHRHPPRESMGASGPSLEAKRAGAGTIGQQGGEAGPGGGRGTEGAERTALDDDEVCARCAPEPPPSRTRPARPGQARAHMLAFQVKGPFPACRRRPAGAATASSITPPSPTRATSKTAGCMTTRMGAPECLCSHVCWLCAGV